MNDIYAIPFKQPDSIVRALIKQKIIKSLYCALQAVRRHSPANSRAASAALLPGRLIDASVVQSASASSSAQPASNSKAPAIRTIVCFFKIQEFLCKF